MGAVALALTACADTQQPTDPKGVTGTPQAGESAVPAPKGLSSVVGDVLDPTEYPAACTDGTSGRAIDDLVPQLFAPGNARRGRAQGLSGNMQRAYSSGDFAAAQTYATELINFALEQYFAGQLVGGQSTSTQQKLLEFIYLIYCYNGIEPIPDLSYIFQTENSTLIRNTTPTTVITDDDKFAGVKINQGDVPATDENGDPFFGTMISVVQSTTPLPTSLDWYGLDGFEAGAFEFIANPAVTFVNPVLTGVCIRYDDIAVPDPAELRLAHAVPAGYTTTVPGNYVVTTAGGTVEIAAPKSTADLGICPTFPEVAVSTFDRAMDLFARVLLPAKLYARRGTSTTKNGGAVATFSPFAAVHTNLVTTSTGPSGTTYIPLNGSQTTEPVSLTVTTKKGETPIDGIPVAFAETGDGSFSASPVNTGSDGKATSTWTLPAGSHSATVTPSKSPLTFAPASWNYSVTVVQETQLTYVSPASLTDGTQNVAYPNTSFTASGGRGAGSYSWDLASGDLPPGMQLSTAGVLSGTPTMAGAYTFTPRVTSGSQTATPAAALTLTVKLPAVVLSPTTLSSPITVGAAYSQQFTATGGAGAGTYSFAVTNGTLPTGLTLSTEGLLSGTPTVAGETRNFTVTVTSTSGGNSESASRAYTLVTANASRINLAFANNSAPSRSVCYAANRPLDPSVQVLITDGSGRPLSGITAGIVAVLNNGSKVQVNPSTATSGADGIANFGGPVINQTGTFVLEISVTTPVSAVLRSAKFNVVPAC